MYKERRHGPMRTTDRLFPGMEREFHEKGAMNRARGLRVAHELVDRNFFDRIDLATKKQLKQAIDFYIIVKQLPDDPFGEVLRIPINIVSSAKAAIEHQKRNQDDRKRKNIKVIVVNENITDDDIKASLYGVIKKSVLENARSNGH